MSILALDLGTSAGWATLNRKSQRIDSGYEKLKFNQFEGGGVRYLRFCQKLDQWHKKVGGIEFIAFEEVRAHDGTLAAHVYGGYLSTLTHWCEKNCVPYMGFPVGTIKKHATGNGGASKATMVKAAQKLGFWVTNEDEADAIHILHLAMDKMGNTFSDDTLLAVKKIIEREKKEVEEGLRD